MKTDSVGAGAREKKTHLAWIGAIALNGTAPSNWYIDLTPSEQIYRASPSIMVGIPPIIAFLFRLKDAVTSKYNRSELVKARLNPGHQQLIRSSYYADRGAGIQ